MSADNSFRDIVTTPEFDSAWQAVVEKPVTLAEFMELPMPRGVEARDLWMLFARLRRHMGETLDIVPWFKGSYGGVSWYALSKQEEFRLSELTALVSPEAHLNELVDARNLNALALSSHLVDEIVSLARFDGLPVSVNQIREIWLQQRRASTPYERVLENASQVFFDAKRFGGRSFSRMLMDDIHELLIDRVGELSLDSMRMFRTDLYDYDLMQDKDYRSDTADTIVRYARNVRSPQDVAMRAALNAFYFWDLQPYESLNRLTEFLVRRVYLVQNRMPALSFARFSKSMELSARSYTLTHEIEASGSESEGLDATWLFAGAIESMLSETRELDALVRRIEQEHRRLQVRLKNLPDLNERQRSFILALRRTRRNQFTLNDYQQYFRVAYATARSDMLELAKLGVLTYTKEGKAFVFRLNTGIDL